MRAKSLDLALKGIVCERCIEIADCCREQEAEPVAAADAGRMVLFVLQWLSGGRRC
jgi:hypothetical protein